jgi:hypothetical protein
MQLDEFRKTFSNLSDTEISLLPYIADVWISAFCLPDKNIERTGVLIWWLGYQREWVFE